MLHICYALSNFICNINNPMRDSRVPRKQQLTEIIKSLHIFSTSVLLEEELFFITNN